MDGITDSMGMSLSKLWEIVKGRKPGVLPWGRRVGHNFVAKQEEDVKYHFTVVSLQ